LTVAVSSAAVTTGYPPGTLRLDECVIVSASSKVRNLTIPTGADDPNPIIVVVPVTVTFACGTEPRSTVDPLVIDAMPPPTTPT
jgi:hypothetical protein